MDRLDAMRLFTRIVERRSFTQAANDTGVPRSTVTQVINQLEERLNVRLLQRTTRTVKPTLDGEAYYRRCISILDDVEDAEGAFSGAEPKGMLRVEVQGTLARHFLLPALPAFFSRYPDVELSMSESDRWVDLVQEGMDCALRYGKLPDSDLIARQVAMLERVTCATPDYFKRFGTPSDLQSLSGHRVVGIRSITTGNVTPLEFTGGAMLESVPLPATFSVTGPESFIAGTRLGFGIAQMPRFHVENDLKNGTLVTILDHLPPPSVPVSLVYPRNRQLSPRVRVFLAWATQEFAKRNSPSQD
ncbi:MAG TPA: LysR substrate-binding domain-containing protein [Telluria sp.]|nr:LysR substrate-binding domain-containing protein [Telluria sp.]